ncbi:MAG: 30S ribosome-binding factor RbfA [Alphaproteobacteria bacterium]
MTRQRGKPEGQRQRRVGEAIRHALVRIVERGHFRDPDLLGVSITVTGVRMSADLRHATARVLRFGGGDTAVLAKALNRAAAYLRGQLAHEVNLRYSPELVFEPDTVFERAAGLDRLFGSPAVVRDLAAEDTGAGAADAAEGERQHDADDEDDHGA